MNSDKIFKSTCKKYKYLGKKKIIFVILNSEQ